MAKFGIIAIGGVIIISPEGGDTDGKKQKAG
jgi:hypothetical protein